jgi:hypothetical protein
MKHLIVFPVWGLLVITSLLIGSVMYLWNFNFKTFRKGSSFINTKLIRFTHWYEFSK